MRYIIPINLTTLPLITALNGGLQPHFEGQTYFIYYSDPEGHNEIVSDQSVWMEGGFAARTMDSFRVLPLP